MKAKIAVVLSATVLGASWTGPCRAESLASTGAVDAVVLPLGRTAYFVGETVPLAVASAAPEVVLSAADARGTNRIYRGQAGPLLLDTARWAPGDYRILLNGAEVVPRLTLVSPLRRSAASLQDESMPSDKTSPDEVVTALRESGLSAVVSWAMSDAGRVGMLDTLARAGTILLANTDTRPTSFVPAGNNPQELDSMSQRMILTAQANGRYPNFGGFCFGWDTTGFAVGNRRMLLVYWGWGNQRDALRAYIDRIDRQKMDEFTRRTGLQPVTEEETIAYLLSIGRPELAPAIDLPTKRWLEEIARAAKPMPEAERAAFEKRLDAWSQYLMGIYAESYTSFMKNLGDVDPSWRDTSSVQVDHAPVRAGQYFPSAYAPLDFRYQSAWNDQIGGPDYLDQWLFVSALLEMGRGRKPTWISSAMASAHALSDLPGKLVRVAAHDLAYGGTGIGFALEGFSNLLGGMNKESNWNAIRGKPGEQDVISGREFSDRFAALALEGRGDHGVGILFSKSQFSRQHLAMGYGTPYYQALITLVRLGYTPRFVTEEEFASGPVQDIRAVVILGQTVPLPAPVLAGLAQFRQRGGEVVADESSSVEIPGARKLALAFPALPGKPHNWGSPNLARGENDTQLYAEWRPELAQGFASALGDVGRGLFRSEKGNAAQVSLLQMDGGRDAKYVLAVNDSFVRNQADWYQVVETLAPGGAATGVVYDCTEEKALGKLAPLACDLSRTTARVLAVLPRPAALRASATQAVRAGADLVVGVEFLDGAQKPLQAVLPFHVAVVDPAGHTLQDFYRATDRQGQFTMAVPVPANGSAGNWKVVVRSQLNGEEVALPVAVAAAGGLAAATPWDDAVVVRDRPAIDNVLPRGAKLILPVFDSPEAAEGRAAAEKAKAVLSKRGVDVEVWSKPATGTYWLAYAPTDDQLKDNARVEAGEAIGVIRRTTVNGNDWFSALSGFRCARPVVLLDLAGVKGDNPMAEHLADAGLLWPEVSARFPGPGRAVVQAVPWAFGPRQTAIVIQAWDGAGLVAGAAALADLPADRLSAGIDGARRMLWIERGIGGRPDMPRGAKLTERGAKHGSNPQPFALRFAGAEPLNPVDVKPWVAPPLAATPVPGTFEPKQYVLQYRQGDTFVETATADMLVPDLRFSDAIKLVCDVKEAGPYTITAEGTFRYSDRKPCWQAQWEDILNLLDRLVPRERRPMAFEVWVGGKPVGTLTATKTETKDVQVEMGPQPKSVSEEVVTQLTGQIELPAGRQELILAKQNIVDGKLEHVAVTK